MKRKRVLFWNVDDIYASLHPFYEEAIKAGFIEVAGYRLPSGNGQSFFSDKSGETPAYDIVFDKVIVSSINDFWRYKKELIKQGFPDAAIIDGRVFAVKGLAIGRFWENGDVQGRIDGGRISDSTCMIYKREYTGQGKRVILGNKSYIANGVIEGQGFVNIGNFSLISWGLYLSWG